MSPPRIAVEVGGAVQEPDGLRHIVSDGQQAYCGATLRLWWRRVPRPTESFGYWCKVCLDAVASTSKEETP